MPRPPSAKVQAAYDALTGEERATLLDYHGVTYNERLRIQRRLRMEHGVSPMEVVDLIATRQREAQKGLTP